MVEPVIIGRATLYNADCRDVLPLLGKVDAVVTDPPYGVLDEEWDAMDERALLAFSMSWLAAVYSISPLLLTFYGERRVTRFPELLTMLYPEVRRLIWNKGGGHKWADGIFYAHEAIYLCRIKKPAAPLVAQPKCRELADIIKAGRLTAGLSLTAAELAVRGRRGSMITCWERADCVPSDEDAATLKRVLRLGADFDAAINKAKAERDKALEAARQRSRENAGTAIDVFRAGPSRSNEHPCAKPMPLMAGLLDLIPDAALVCDPFMGSGTTGVAAVQMGRSFIGIEREPAYFATACKRIEDAQRQVDMFIEAAAGQRDSHVRQWDGHWSNEAAFEAEEARRP
jgi:hypothetical protein